VEEGIEGDLMARILVIRAEMGKVVESKVVEGELYEVVRGYVSSASLEWDPRVSDFVVIKEDLETDVGDLPDRDTLESLTKYGSIEKVETGYRVRIPVYTISFDNRSLKEDVYVENKVYVISVYVNDDLRALLESEAASITVQETPPEGVSEA
jgi:hypothetical protein